MSAASLQDARVRLAGRLVLDQVSLCLEPGELVALLGPNGSGKSTTIKAALGLLPLEAGEARLGDVPLRALGPRERGRRASYLPQTRRAVWSIEARDLVALGRFAYGSAPYERLSPADRAAVDEALERCDAADLARRGVDTLSGGEQARVHLARALAAGAPALLADEPAAALDPRHQYEAMALLRAEADSGRGVLVALHDLHAARRWADRVVVLDAGRIAAQGAPGEALDAGVLAQVFGVREGEGGFVPD
ncbi:ABC transporter ATP-binding protein [Marinicauda algicola]|uniref:ABC transporter ATP-binding protein n=1 Tax=Marinicauda algicola TaxID=2029849 RepID=A0A4S2H4P1_9PROT|nr:ABC transporter ATP-binding protein [Marinicauda algicola]TGY90596.1 ABC transporter ATP-binding protein [Marinicauda algicola]